MTRTRWLLAAALVGALTASSPMVPPASTASAGEASGCRGSADSYGPSGGLLDSVVAPGRGGTQQDPFDIFEDGTVQYEGSTDVPMRNGSWAVELGGAIGVIATLFEAATGKNLLSGTIGDDPVTTRSGTIDAKKYASHITGLQLVTVRLTAADGASCVATVWVRVHGPFWKSLVALAGSFILLIGLLLLIGGAPAWAVENITFEVVETFAAPTGDGATP